MDPYASDITFEVYILLLKKGYPHKVPGRDDTIKYLIPFPFFKYNHSDKSNRRCEKKLYVCQQNWIHSRTVVIDTNDLKAKNEGTYYDIKISASNIK